MDGIPGLFFSGDNVPLRNELARMFVSAGWRKVNDTLRLDVDAEWSMIVGLGTLNKRDDVSPALGIRSESVEKLVSELMALDDAPYVATVGADLGYVLGGDYKIWSTPEYTAEEIYDQVLVGLDRMRPYMTLETVIDGYTAILAAEAFPSAHYQMVVIELLRGRRDAVAQQMADAEKMYCRREGKVCDNFRAFQQRAHERFPELV